MRRPDRIPAVRVWLVLAKCYRVLALHVERSIAATGLCASDFMALEALLHKGPLTISAIGEKVLLSSGSMTAAIDRLERQRLVTRQSTASDRRARIVELTAQGRQLTRRVFRAHERDLETIMAILSEEERRQLYEPLKKLGISALGALQNPTNA
jgi:MarR family 2-MHQ and catechol resistance regulon transcriptional repressor